VIIGRNGKGRVAHRVLGNRNVRGIWEKKGAGGGGGLLASKSIGMVKSANRISRGKKKGEKRYAKKDHLISVKKQIRKKREGERRVAITLLGGVPAA